MFLEDSKKQQFILHLFSCIMPLILSFFGSNLYAQYENTLVSQTILPSPQAVSLVKDVAYPVGNYTGVPVISVPVGVLEGKEISYPLALLYHTQNVNSYSTSIMGQGWTLKGVGLITRVINGNDDLDEYGYSLSTIPEVNGVSSSYVNEAAQRTRDTAPDLFYFSFLGNQGKFFIGQDGEIITDGASHLTIIPPSEPNNPWEVIDDRGYHFIFGQSGALETAEVKGSNVVTSWYLSQVISPLKEELNFNYKPAKNVNNSGDYLPGRFRGDSGGDFYQFDLETAQSYSVPYLESVELIHASYGRKFYINYYSDNTSDGMLLKNIRLSALASVGVEEGKDPLDSDNVVYNWNTLSVCKFYYSESGENFDLQYGEFYTGSLSEPSSTFKANYSEAPNEKPLLSRMDYSSGKKVSYTYELHDVSSLNQSSILSQVDLGVRLKKITNSGQEETEVRYTYTDNLSNSSARLMIEEAGDLEYRASRWYINSGNLANPGTVTRNNIVSLFQDVLGGPIITYDWVITESDKKGKILYGYTNGNTLIESSESGYYNKAFAKPMYGLSFKDGKLKEKTIYKKVDDGWHAIDKTSFEYEELSREPLKVLNILFPNATNNQNINDATNTISNDIGAVITYHDILGIQTFGVPTSWSRLKESESVYSEDPGVSRITSSAVEYTSNNYIRSELTTLADGKELSNTYTYPFDYPSIAVFEEMINRNMLSYGIEQTVRKRNVTAEEFTLIGGSINEYGFFPDSDDENDLPSLTNENILIKSSYNWESTGGEVISDIPSISDENYRLEVEFDYDKEGFLIQSNSRTGEIESTIWDKSTYLPASTVYNAAFNDVYYNGFEEDGRAKVTKLGLRSHDGGNFSIPFVPGDISNYLMSYWYFSNDKWHLREKSYDPEINEGTALDEIKVYPKDALMTSSSYDKKGKILSQTDQNNRSVFYEYDTDERIKHIKDSEGNIVRSYDHFESKLEECGVNNSSPIEASFKDGEQISMDVGESYSIKVNATGGCGGLVYRWYIIYGNNNSQFLGQNDSGEIEIVPPCKRHFQIRCEITDRGENYVETIRSYVKVNVDDAEVGLDLISNTGSFVYCQINYDQINVSSQVTGTCGNVSYSWVYTYADGNSTSTLTSTSANAVFPFKGRGSLECRVVDSYGHVAESSRSIGQDHNCLD